ncbi:uncharacterized protein LOC131326444 [Rhododendron vialii]|uniref:uncharacterized protein LOC131326444 n=1 Tax=Rhododendron vialii TaxID=182163 RepID=UPI00265DC0DA|nr:uncharacterized protein LOC131326444 [Rhododendron vialii]
MKKQSSGQSGYFPDDCWELIFHKMRENNERELDSISLVSKQFLSISNQVKLSLNVNNGTLPLLPNLLQRFRHIKTIVIDINAQKDIDGLVDQISRSGVLNLQAIKFGWCMTEPPRHGFKALALNKNIKNNLKVLNCSAWTYMQDNDLDLIADCFPLLEELRISAYTKEDNHEVAERITDDGVDALASKLKELKKIVFKGNACFITDQSLISLSTNCVKLTKIGLSLSTSSQHRVTGDGVGFVTRHSPNLTSLSLSLKLWSPQHSAISLTRENVFTDAKNLRSLTMNRYLISVKHICFIAKARPPLKKLKLVGFSGRYCEIYGALKMLLQACRLTLKKLTLIGWSLTDTVITDLAQYLSNLTSIFFFGPFGLTSAAFYTLTKSSCPLLEILQMTHTGGREMDLSLPKHRNYQLRHLYISHNIWVNDTTLENFGQVCPNLQILDVSYCTRLTNSGIGEVLRRCPAITQLNIWGLNISDVFGSYSDHSILNLKTLEAQDTQIDDEGMAMIGNRCRNLQYLDIGNCKKVTDKGVMEVVRNCKRLRDILMGGCEKVSASIVLQMVSSRPSLRNIEPPCFDDLSEQMIDKVLSFGCRLSAIRLWLSS